MDTNELILKKLDLLNLKIEEVNSRLAGIEDVLKMQDVLGEVPPFEECQEVIEESILEEVDDTVEKVISMSIANRIEESAEWDKEKSELREKNVNTIKSSHDPVFTIQAEKPSRDYVNQVEWAINESKGDTEDVSIHDYAKPEASFRIPPMEKTDEEAMF